MSSTIKALVFDLGGVLLSWDHHTVTALSSSQFLTIMNSTTWHSLDRGLLSLKDACKEFGALLGEEPSVIEGAIEQAQDSLAVNFPLVETLLEVKATNPELKLYVMSNISREHYKAVRKLGLPWSVFDHIFISGLEGMRKPDICFFQHVVEHTGFRPGDIAMIDDTVENICAARSVGIHGIFVHDRATKSGGSLLNLLQDPLARAETYLRENARDLHSSVEGRDDLLLKDNFAQLMIWELLGDESLIYLRWPSGHLQGAPNNNTEDRSRGKSEVLMNGHVDGRVNGSDEAHLRSDLKNGLWNYFYEEPALTARDFPPDADTTSTAYLSLPPEYLPRVADPGLVLDAMAANQSPDGITQTYFSSDRPRTAPEVCCNILRAFYRFGRGPDPRIRKTEEWVVGCLRNDACLHGNRYYSTPESFLYFVSRLYVECRSASRPLADELEPAIRRRLGERVNMPTNPLALALRVFACQIVGVDGGLYRKDFDLLLSLQERDGGWPAGHFCRVGKTGARIGNRGLTTAFAIRAIRNERSREI
ncbi:putative had-like protein [Rosellinia necatrix]|uniref:Putative had-like protein n=1 Tax=Rosellinia necatrix TaxID=77044 RepID=A0A1S8A787_ROSNE|nr:putative had-like protein [Rosellinia necatrix]